MIYTFPMGLEGMYLWDARNYTGPAGFGRDGESKTADTLGDIEFMIKGMHRVSQLNRLFEGEHAFVRPVRHYDTFDRDHPLVRGVLNGRYSAGDDQPVPSTPATQTVELWYDAPYEGGRAVVSAVWLQARRTHLFQCKLLAARRRQGVRPRPAVSALHLRRRPPSPDVHGDGQLRRALSVREVVARGRVPGRLRFGLRRRMADQEEQDR
ncbi:MAG: hypothetical protein U0736_22045 [Gemmataceae bacterium]